MSSVLQHNNKVNPDLPLKLSLAISTGRDSTGWTIWLLTYTDCQSFHILSSAIFFSLKPFSKSTQTLTRNKLNIIEM
jgi:hypothetical protein